MLLLSSMWTPFNVLLVGLAAISIGTGDRITFTIMLLMVVLSTSLKYWQELKSLSKAASLVNSVTSTVHVLRPGSGSGSSDPEEIQIDRKQVVPGDILAVASGDVFPGDCVLISSLSLCVSQASLTGELMPREKSARLSRSLSQEAIDIFDSDNICLAGTSVTSGNGRALVLSTGGDTYMASIAKELAEKRPLNAMQLGVRSVAMILFVFMLVMAPLVLVIQGTISKDWKASLLFAIAVAVGLTPEMLPMIVASNLALSAIRVARKNVIVKRFDAIQNLGAVSILCSDKTGTLTVDYVHVSVSTTDSGVPSDLPAKLAYVNSAMQTGTRSPIDSAVMNHVQEKQSTERFADVNLNGWVKLGEIPFDSARRLLSVLVSRPQNEGGGRSRDALFITKGAVDEVLECCTRVFSHPRPPFELESPSSPVQWPSLLDFDPDVPMASSLLTDHRRNEILQTAERLNEDGLRLVAVACKLSVVKYAYDLDARAEVTLPLSSEDEEGLSFIGFLGFLDPPKADAKGALERLKNLNVQVRILTGDSPAVAAKVARDLGILMPRRNMSSAIVTQTQGPHIAIEMGKSVDEKDLIVTGPQLAELSNAENRAALREVVERGIIFAKLSPHQKLEVVEMLRSAGPQGASRAVAFLGDGVNDALAIRGADVGISVDSGTEIAKEAADVILLEKSLDVVAEGVLQGRITFVNTIKYVKMAASSNFGNVLSVLVASLWLPYQPMLPLQLLTQNLLYDFSQGSIPWDNVDPEYLEHPKTWNSMSIVRFMLCIGPLSSPFDVCTFLLNCFKYGIRTARSPLVPRAQAHWFIEGSLTQLFIIHYLRTPKIPFIQSRASTQVVLVTSCVAVVSMAIPWLPVINKVFKFEPPAIDFYGFLVAIVAAYALLVHVGKAIYQRVFKEWL